MGEVEENRAKMGPHKGDGQSIDLRLNFTMLTLVFSEV